MSTGVPRGLKDLLPILVLLVTLAYPFLVYLNIDAIAPYWFGALLLVMALLRLIVAGKKRQRSDWIITAVIAVFSSVMILLDSTVLLKCYPVMMSAFMGLIFLLSLRDEHNLIERFAVAGGKQPPAQASGYLQKLCIAWGCLLLLNSAVAAWTVWFASLAVWTLYNGLLSYLLMAGFIVIELVYRNYYKKKHNIVDE
ncbi:hypothetical protein [Alteromonas gilva]|uniref:DNA gyrase subunit B n=1 Tax=Alteromonas gilva TaxID=2987522 RepID=A0ABT5KZ44_9ALTE|nr:hypothetical protein [Alteromonas gilva]MDC8829464.1 hypothetical protein [Alteromonas gilva]